MKKILTSFIFIIASITFAQVGVNNDNPQTTLHIDAKEATGTSTGTDGILIPRVDRARAQAMQNVEHSTLIYVDNVATGAQSGKANQIDAKGFYYFDTEVNSGEWVKLGGASTATQTWEQIKYNQTNGKFVMTAKNQLAPKNTWLIYSSGNLSPVRLPKMQAEDAGRMIVAYKEGSGNLQVQDWQGLVAGEVDTELISESSVRANRGRTFLWTGEAWITTNY